MNILLVTAYSRENSLTAAVAGAFTDAATSSRHRVELANLQAESFDPVLQEPDEPDWNNPSRIYSDAVRQEMLRIERNDATVMVFPVWWWSMPAILKGWIDRVWNFGWAYGGGTYPHRRVLMIAIAGNLLSSYKKRGYDAAMLTQLETGILRYCGVEEARLVTLYGSIEGEPHPAGILAAARELGSTFGSHHPTTR